MVKVHRYFEIFARRTTFQGFQELLDAKGWCEKGFWLLAIILALAFSILLIYLGCAHFFKEPVATTVTRSREGPVTLDVLYCPANWVHAEKLGTLKNVTVEHLAYALSIFRGDNYPEQAGFPSLAPLTHDEAKNVDFTSHMQRMFQNVLPVSLAENQEFKAAWKNLTLEERFFLNPENLAVLAESMSAEQIGQAIKFYIQKDYDQLAEYIMTNVRIKHGQNVMQMDAQYRKIGNKTEYSTRPIIAKFFHEFGKYRLLDNIKVVLSNVSISFNDEMKDDPECKQAPLLCCNEYGLNCRSYALYPAERSRPTPRELITMLDKLETGNETTLYAFVQKFLEQRVIEQNQLNKTKVVFNDQIWNYYQILLVEYIISETYKTKNNSLLRSTATDFFDSKLPFEEIANFRFIKEYMAVASLEKYATQYDLNVNMNVRRFREYSVIRNPEFFDGIAVYIRSSAEFQEFLERTGSKNSADSLRNFLDQTNTTEQALEWTMKLLDDAITSWLATEQASYANFLRRNGFNNTFDFLRAISPNASQILYSLSLSDSNVVRPASSDVEVTQIFNQLGACYRFSVFVESTSVHYLKSSHEKIIYPSFTNRVYLTVYMAESVTLLGSNRADDLLFFGEEVLEDYPLNAIKITSDRGYPYTPRWYDVRTSVTDFVYQSKQNRNKAPCRSDVSYSTRKCVADCNDQYANGEVQCKYLRENEMDNQEIFAENICSLFRLMHLSVPPASLEKNKTDWNSLYKCYAQCSPACSQWYMKVNNDSYASAEINTLDERITDMVYDDATMAMVYHVGNGSNKAGDIPNGWSFDSAQDLREAILRENSYTHWLTCITVSISTEVTMYFEEFTFTWDALFGIVGGQVGLVMGASCLSFVQLGYLLFVAWKKDKSVHFKPNKQLSVKSVQSSTSIASQVPKTIHDDKRNVVTLNNLHHSSSVPYMV